MTRKFSNCKHWSCQSIYMYELYPEILLSGGGPSNQSLIGFVNYNGICDSMIMHSPKHSPPPFHGFSSNWVVTHSSIGRVNSAHMLVVVSKYVMARYLFHHFVNLATNSCERATIQCGKCIYILVITLSCRCEVFVIQKLIVTSLMLLTLSRLQWCGEVMVISMHSSRSSRVLC